MSLTVPQIKNAKPREKIYRLADEKGMYLEIHPKGGKYWRLKYRINGKEKRISLGFQFLQVRIVEGRAWARTPAGPGAITALGAPVASAVALSCECIDAHAENGNDGQHGDALGEESFSHG